MRCKNIFLISRLELKRNKSLAKKEFLLTLVPTLVVFGIIFLTLMTKGFFVGERFYRVDTNDDTVRQIVGQHPRFVLGTPADVELIRIGGGKYVLDYRNNDRGKSAAYMLLETLKQYNRAIYDSLEEGYPLLVQVNFTQRDAKPGLAPIDQQQGFGEPTESLPPATPNVESSDLAQSSTSLSTKTKDLASTEPLPDLSQSSFGDVQRETGGAVPPSQMNVLSSFGSMYLAMFLIFPLTMIGIIYSNSIMQEKINRRMHVLLTMPVSRADIILGKTLPYIALSLVSTFAVAVKGVSWSVLPFVLLSSMVITVCYLSIAFLVSTLARDSKELSFFMIFFLSLYSFLLLIPAFLTTISDISLISPLSIVARLFDGQAFTFLHGLTLIPHVLMGLALFTYGASMFNEENLFGYRKVTQKMLSGLSELVSTKTRLFLYTCAIVPFAFVFEMILLLFTLSTTTHLIVVVLLLAALTEEGLKCLGYYALIRNKDISSIQVFQYGFLGGLGFFLIEKGSVLFTITDLLESYTLLVIGGLAVPLLLHVGLAIGYFALLKKFGKEYAFTSFLVVSLTHFLINLNLVRLAL